MSALRKLQADIDRTLKKIDEGIAVFDEIWSKVHDTDNANQKEKFEADLKKEIKKLQRLRDQIKTWISGADIKDKTPLVDARKAIEREMERFKLCEKETKMKQFSKAALGQADKLDPREQARAESREWINNTVDSLNAQIESYEYEIEELKSTLKKKSKPPPRLVSLEEIVSTHKEHALKLELALRCLDNEAVSPEEVDALRDDLDYYLQQDDSEHYDNTEDMYALINDRLEAVAAETMALPTSHGKTLSKEGKTPKGDKGGKGAAEEEKDRERERERAAAAAVKAQLIAQGVTSVKPLDDDDHKPGRPVVVVPPASGPSTAQPSPGMPNSPLAPTPRAAAAAAAVAATGQRDGGDTAPPSPAARVASGGAASGGGAAAAAPTAAPPPGAGGGGGQGRPGAWTSSSPEGAAQPRQAQPADAPPAGAGKGPPPGMPTPSGVGAPPSKPLATAPTAAAPHVLAAGSAAAGRAPGSAAAATTAAALVSGASASGGGQALGHSSSMEGSAKDVLESRSSLAESLGEPAGSMHGSIDSADVAAAKAAAAANAAAQPTAPAPPALDAHPAGVPGAAGLGSVGEGSGVSGSIDALTRMAAQEFGLPGGQLPLVAPGSGIQVLEACYRSALPQPSDTDWARYRPRHPVGAPSSYPKAPPEVVSNPALFRKMDPEALFFAFYYQPDTYQQYLAAQELKRQSWRYHKHHNAWFQRYAEPQHTTDEFEQGTYVYFDFNIVHDDMQTGWCYRRKENFTFRYDALEDELHVTS